MNELTPRESRHGDTWETFRDVLEFDELSNFIANHLNRADAETPTRLETYKCTKGVYTMGMGTLVKK